MRVTWTDAYFEFEGGEPRTDYRVTTVGFLLERGPMFVRVAGESTPDGWRAVTAIPSSTVLDLAEVERP